MKKRIARFLLALGFVPAIFISSAPIALADEISTEGPNSDVNLNSSTQTTITNNNSVSISSSNTQYASSGDATVSNNTTGGSATSGNASNDNDTDICVSITNSTFGGGNAGCPGGTQPPGGGGGQGGGPTAGGGVGGGRVLGVTTAVMVGGKGAFSVLPSTGVRDGMNLWLLSSLLVLASSALYWKKAISPKLKALRK